MSGGPMRLLEPGRLVRDEGIAGTFCFLVNLMKRPAARKRVFRMRRLFREYARHLEAVALVCLKI